MSCRGCMYITSSSEDCSRVPNIDGTNEWTVKNTQEKFSHLIVCVQSWFGLLLNSASKYFPQTPWFHMQYIGQLCRPSLCFEGKAK